MFRTVRYGIGAKMSSYSSGGILLIDNNTSSPSPLRGEARKTAIVNAAIELVTEHGAGRLSVADVAKRASASKETVYRHFGNRTGLLIAGVKSFARFTLEACPSPPPNETFENGLIRLGTWYLNIAKEPTALSFYRYVVGGAEESPELGKAFTEEFTNPIVSEFEKHMKLNYSAGKSREIAETFMGMLQGKFWNRALVEPELKITNNEVKKQVKLASSLLNSAII